MQKFIEFKNQISSEENKTKIPLVLLKFVEAIPPLGTCSSSPASSSIIVILGLEAAGERSPSATTIESGASTLTPTSPLEGVSVLARLERVERVQLHGVSHVLAEGLDLTTKEVLRRGNQFLELSPPVLLVGVIPDCFQVVGSK